MCSERSFLAKMRLRLKAEIAHGLHHRGQRTHGCVELVCGRHVYRRDACAEVDVGSDNLRHRLPATARDLNAVMVQTKYEVAQWRVCADCADLTTAVEIIIISSLIT